MNINDDHIAIVDNGEMITFKDGKLQVIEILLQLKM